MLESIERSNLNILFMSTKELKEVAKNDSLQSLSSWMATSQPPAQPSLTKNLRTQVCVIGGGIAGITTAYLLAQQGKKVVLLTAGEVGGSNANTARTTAHLSNAVDDRYTEIERLHGQENSRLVAQSHTAAISKIEAIAETEGIECDFERVDGYLFTPPGESSESLYRELEAAQRAGLSQVEMVDHAPIQGFNTGPCLRFPEQGQFHPLKYLNGLAQAIVRDGGQIYTNTAVSRIKGGKLAQLRTAQGYIVTAEAVVVATNAPINDLWAASNNDLIGISAKQAAYRTYVIAGRVPTGSVTKALYWDTPDPYHYIRLQKGEAKEGEAPYDLLMVGGEDHKTGQEDDGEQRYQRLEQWTRERFPMMEKLEYWWSGQVMESVDGLAFIGHDQVAPPNVYIATGDSGMGMTHGTIAGMILSDLILGRKNSWANLYDPSRVTLGAAPDFIQETANLVAQYTDWLTPGEVDSTGQIQSGEGAIMRRGLRKVAVHRDEQGILHQRSAICPHLGCIVAWNSSEKSWDCPCHGSHFSANGKVLNGPSIHGLGQVNT